jgi:photosystem II stability/assembly factor-like uncharacterized protein
MPQAASLLDAVFRTRALQGEKVRAIPATRPRGKAGWGVRVARTVGALALAAGGAMARGTTLPNVSPWLSIGPPGGSFSGLFATPASPATVYLAVPNGAVWRSPDGGHTWGFAGSTLQPPANAFPAPPPLVVDPSGGGTVYANNLFGIFKSTDGGSTWTHRRSAVEVLAVAPSAPQTLYLYDLDGPAALSRSDDGGETWNPTGTFPTGFLLAAAVAVDPTTPATVYVLGTSGTFLKSVDSGAHWIDPFSPETSGVDQPLALLIDPASASTLYLALRRPAGEGGAGAGVFRSDDAGATWVAAGSGLPADLPLSGIVAAPSGSVYAAVVDPGANTTRIYGSAGGGTPFQQVSAPAGTLSLAVDFQAPDHLLLLGSSGVIWSDDGGHNWTSPAHQPSGSLVRQVAAGPGSTGSVYAVSSDTPLGISGTFSLQLSSDGGNTWSKLTSPPFLGIPFLVLDAQPGILYAMTHGPLVNNPVVSFDGGTTWRPLAQPPGVTRAAGALDLAADPFRSGKLVELSCDQAPAGPDFFSCEFGNFTLSHTNTYGRGWRVLGRDPTLFGPPKGEARIDPSNPALAYCVFEGTVFRSDPASHLLVALAGLSGSIVDLAVDPQSPATLYAVTDRNRPLWKSLDHGASWVPASLGLPRGAGHVNLAIDPTNSKTLYLATRQGVFFSDDRAASWQPLGSGLPGYAISWVAASASLPRTVWVGTAGGGVFAITRP